MKLSAVISLKDNYSTIMKQAAKHTSSFSQDVDKAKRQLKALEDNMKKEKQLRFDTRKAAGELTKFERLKEHMKDKAVKITARTEHFFEQHAKLAASINKLTRAPAVITIKARDLVTGAVPGIMRAATGTMAVGATAAAGVGLASLKGASSLERNQISMEHFIGINNKVLSAAKVKELSDQYLKDLRKNADLTPFETGDVIASGTRAIGIAAGSTKQAMSLLRLAEDMAALSPGKTLGDAMEALADLKTGETERMKEFGFKISQDQIKAAGGKMENIRNAEGIALGQMFQGGAEKLGQSSDGLWSTITGTIKSGITDMGKDTLEFLKPQLKLWADFLSGGGARKMFEAGSRMMVGVTKAVIDKAKEVQRWINEKFLDNVEFNNLPTFNAKFHAVWSEINKSFDAWWDTKGAGMFSGFVSKSIKVLADSASRFADPAMKIGLSIGEGLLKGLNQFAEQNKEMAAILTFISTPGTVQTKAIAAAGVGTGILPEVVKSAGAMKDGINQDFQTFNEKGFWGGLKDMASDVKEKWTVRKVYDENGDRLLGKKLQEYKKSLHGPPEKKAIGMERIPRDNYPILAHQGERLLTAQEARQQDQAGKAPVHVYLNVSKQQQDEASEILRLIRSVLEPAGYNFAGGVGS
ncbi:hypothetical protein [Gorillibacterium sp. sgz5001074]|uniref:hypothetical protein n=1 Tax=Gorillibacterium sp. sgz5001074 TaxID=3446695 RepID=UPI003F66EB05